MYSSSRLNLKQILFIKYYTNPHCNTFGNGLQAYKKAYGVENSNTAKSNASRLLSNAYIRNIIDEELQHYGMDMKDSLSLLFMIIKGEFTESNITFDDNGRQSYTIKTPSAGTILKAISLINRFYP